MEKKDDERVKIENPKQGLVKIYPPIISPEDLSLIETKYLKPTSVEQYKITKDVTYAKTVSDSLPDLTSLERNEVVEKNVARAPEIATHNYQELFRATAAKWYASLTELFRDGKVSRIPTHEKDCPVKILIAGAHFGAEIGGILDWFNAQGIRVSITAVDNRQIEKAEEYRNFLNLEEREKVCGSKVEFATEDVIDFAKDKVFDMVVLRHPGPIFHQDQQKVWKDIFISCLGAEPSLVILSTYNYEINDPLAAGSMVSKVTEAEIFDQWLVENSFRAVSQEDDNQHRLIYPHNIYMAPREPGTKKFTRPADSLIRLYINEKADL